MSPFLIVFFVCVGCVPIHPDFTPKAHESQQLVRFNKGSVLIQDSRFIEYEGFSLSFNSVMHIPNWVAYELTSAETDGPYSRKGKVFQADPLSQVYQADGDDYRGSGWSRGHMAPAADFKWSDTALLETFYYTNICPQDIQLNNRYWNTLENKVRGWASLFGGVYVVTGPLVGRNSFGTIGAHRVVIPDAFFKAVLACVEGEWISVAFVMANTSEPRLLKDCVTTVNEVERLSGLDLFFFLDDSVEEIVEGLSDRSVWKVY